MLENTFSKKYVKFCCIVIFLCFLLLLGCDKENEEELPVASYPIKTANIEGKVIGTGGYSNLANSNIYGAAVNLNEINTDGSVHTVSNKSVTTDANGIFHSALEYSGANKILVTASSGSKTWKSIINNDVKNGLTYYVQPLNDESTIEVEVYIEALKNKFTNVLYPDISVFIDETIAEKVIQKIVTPVQIASAINDVKKIETSAILNKQFVLMQVDIEKLNSSISFAQSLLERNLYYSKNQSDYDAAFASFYESIVSSYITSGLQPEIFYKILEIAHRTLLRSIAGFDEPTRIEIEKRASQVRAYVLNYAVQSMFNQLDPDLQMYKEIVNAGGKLFISINQSKTHSEIIENFAEYHAEALNAISKLLGVRSDVIKTLDKNLDGLKARLITSVNNETSNDSLINEYLIFFSEAEAIITQSINNDDNQVKISADILVLLNMQF